LALTIGIKAQVCRWAAW